MDLEKHARINVVNGRSLEEFEKVLGFSREILRGKKVLNFGCGGSNIGKTLNEKGYNVDLVDMDILPNPISVHEQIDSVSSFEQNRFLTGIVKQKVLNNLQGLNEEYISQFQEENFLQPGTDQLESARRDLMKNRIKRIEDKQTSFSEFDKNEDKVFNIEGRNFIQFNNREIQIKDGNGDLVRCPENYFDYGLVLWVFHQIEQDDIPYVIGELMRTCKNLLIAPVWGINIFELERKLEKYNYEIKSVMSLSTSTSFTGKTVFGQPVLVSDESIKNLKNSEYDPPLLPDIDEGEIPKKVNAYGAARVILSKNLL